MSDAMELDIRDKDFWAISNSDRCSIFHGELWDRFPPEVHGEVSV